MPARKVAVDRRKYQRVTIEAALALVHCLTDQDTAADLLPPMVSEDISPDGIFIRTCKPLQIGAQILLKLHLPTMTKPFTCVARVARVERRRNGEIRGVGLQFLEVPDEHRQLLVEHLYRSYQIQHDEQ